MKTWLKTTLLILLSFVIVYFMIKHNFLDLTSIKNAFVKNKKIIFLVFFIQVLACFLMTLRYFTLLKLFNIKADFKNVTAATFVSNGLGLWMPGSMAFIEIIRIGLMLGAEHRHVLNSSALKNQPSIEENREQLSLRSRLTTVSLFDRLIGLWAMLFIGFFIIGYILIYSNYTGSNNYQNIGLFSILIFTISIFLFITFLPYISKKIIFRKIIEHVERLFLLTFKRGVLNKLFKRIFFEINSILDAVAIGGEKSKEFILPIFYSFIAVFIQALAIYYSALAISSFIPYPAILATISIVAIAALFPIGFGGIGGVQFIAAIALSFFGVMPQSAASAQLLQTTINILSISFIGLFFFKVASKQIKAAFKMYKNKKLVQN